MTPEIMESWQFAIRYHEATKHHVHRYARSLGYMDWANQPDPFRRFTGAPAFLLPLSQRDESPRFSDVYTAPATVPPRRISPDMIGRLLEFSMALSAWKEYKASRWALRCNPSSGNLHPTEAYLVIDAIDGLHGAPGVYHYAPSIHALEMRTDFPKSTWAELTGGFPRATFFVALASVHWREAWKYGERAYRYCQHDAGHALASIAYSAAALGWTTVVCDDAADEEIARLLGLDRTVDFVDAEREQPELLLAVAPTGARATMPHCLPPAAIVAIAARPWRGRANRLSKVHTPWSLIDKVAEACAKTQRTSAESDWSRPAAGPSDGRQRLSQNASSAWAIFSKRRSAVAMDGRTPISADAFYTMLDHVVPVPGRFPWAVLRWPVSVHLVLFVHRVTGLTPGLYCLVREAGHFQRLKALMTKDFQWQHPTCCPADLPLYRLAVGDYRQVAEAISCGQAIAAEGAFSAGMIADFQEPLRKWGAWFYRTLFWETGVIGQVLYLEAEAAGVSATGIGCFFDDAVHEVVGLGGHEFQSIYHFTVGSSVEDTRLTTLPAYSEQRRVQAAEWIA